MNRSPDDIFAAQFWAWPDPALKRDAQGRVLFVNAAFLHLFGGSVDVWRGQIVQGWNPPQTGPAPARFEIRTPATDDYPEQVYDWIEQCDRDGSGFAIARNVTAFVEAAQDQTPPEPVHAEPIHAEPSHAKPSHAESGHAATVQGTSERDISDPPMQAASPVDPTATAGNVGDAQADTGPSEYRANASDSVSDTQYDAPPAALQDSVAQAVSNISVAPAAIAPAAVPPEVAPVGALAQNLTDASSHREAEPERDFERRALPIENEDSILGNNWRDAVIAKAVGGKEGADRPTSLRRVADAANMPAVDPIRILLAEDNAINALLTRTLLEADGHTVETVEDGVLAVESMKTQSYDMIFMDMRMPNMDGLEATRKIRALPNVPQDLPIVALTANAFDDDRNACFDSGMNDFMTKPVSAEELSEMVTRWTTGSEASKLAS